MTVMTMAAPTATVVATASMTVATAAMTVTTARMAALVRAVALLGLFASTLETRTNKRRSGNGLRVQLLQLLANSQIREMRLSRKVVGEASTPHAASLNPLVNIVDREHASTHIADTVLLRLRRRLRANDH